MYITGGVSVGEHYEDGYKKPITGNVVETCATMSWMQLSQNLLELTGAPKYADAIERLMLNHVFAAQDAETGSCRYHTPPNGFKPEGYFHGPDCCTASGHRIISLLPTFFYAQKGRDFYINQFVPSEYRDGRFSLDVMGDYPEAEHIRIRLNSTADKTLHLRIPAWCSNPSVSVNGSLQEGVESGKYFSINRKWRAGDIIDISFPMDSKWVLREHAAESENAWCAFVRGPLVYAADMVWNKQIGNDDVTVEREVIVDKGIMPFAVDKPDSRLLGPVFKTEARYMGRCMELLLTPFANIGQWYRKGEDKPSRWSKAYSYGIWMRGK